MLKKNLCVFLILMIFTAALMGCGNQNISSGDGTPDSVDSSLYSQSETSENKEIIYASGENFGDFSVVGEYKYDFNSDGKEDIVSLCTDAEVGSDGKFLWNDGQNWALYSIINDEMYVLFNEYISNGAAYFEVSEHYNGDTFYPNITLVASSGTSLRLWEFKYLTEDSGFAKTERYNSKDYSDGGINRVYTMLEDVK